MTSSSRPPPAPDPAATAAAQTTSNVNTALAQGQLNNVNQITPYGNLTYSSAPSSVNVGGVNVPQYTATQTLSPQEQKLFNLDEATKGNIAQIGVDQSAKIGNLLNTPIDISPSAVDSHLTDLGMARLQPQLDRSWQQRESDLMNRGIMPGSQQYQLEQDAFNRQKNDAYNQLILSGYGQGVQDLLTQRNQPINEITALLSGGQVSQPNYVNTPNTNVQPTNVAGIYNDAYQNQLQSYGLQQGQKNAMMGGLFGLGSAALMAPMTGGTSLGGWGISKLFGR